MKPFIHHRIVEFHETDAAGLVHFSNYFRWAEAAEHALFRELAYPMMKQEGTTYFGWPRVRAQAKYSAPFYSGDAVRVELFVEEVKERAVDYRFRVYREKENQLAAKGSFATMHVTIDGKTGGMTSAPIPEELQEGLRQWVQSRKEPESP